MGKERETVLACVQAREVLVMGRERGAVVAQSPEAWYW
jgi:hypothetical protein